MISHQLFFFRRRKFRNYSDLDHNDMQVEANVEYYFAQSKK